MVALPRSYCYYFIMRCCARLVLPSAHIPRGSFAVAAPHAGIAACARQVCNPFGSTSPLSALPRRASLGSLQRCCHVSLVCKHGGCTLGLLFVTWRACRSLVRARCVRCDARSFRYRTLHACRHRAGPAWLRHPVLPSPLRRFASTVLLDSFMNTGSAAFLSHRRYALHALHARALWCAAAPTSFIHFPSTGCTHFSYFGFTMLPLCISKHFLVCLFSSVCIAHTVHFFFQHSSATFASGSLTSSATTFLCPCIFCLYGFNYLGSTCSSVSSFGFTLHSLTLCGFARYISSLLLCFVTSHTARSCALSLLPSMKT